MDFPIFERGEEVCNLLFDFLKTKFGIEESHNAFLDKQCTSIPDRLGIMYSSVSSVYSAFKKEASKHKHLDTISIHKTNHKRGCKYTIACP